MDQSKSKPKTMTKQEKIETVQKLEDLLSDAQDCMEQLGTAGELDDVMGGEDPDIVFKAHSTMKLWLEENEED